MIRIGHGFDTHAFVLGKPLVLGGVTIPHERGLLAHSDGDAVIHAIVDALLGAVAKGDIGALFPDTAKENAGRNSRDFLEAACRLISDDGYCINNLDVTIIAETPKMAPHIEAMREVLAAVMRLEQSQVNIKATRNEGMGYIGREEGIAVHAVVLLSSAE